MVGDVTRGPEGEGRKADVNVDRLPEAKGPDRTNDVAG
jgi:hypothetical protein